MKVGFVPTKTQISILQSYQITNPLRGTPKKSIRQPLGGAYKNLVGEVKISYNLELLPLFNTYVDQSHDFAISFDWRMLSQAFWY